MLVARIFFPRIKYIFLFLHLFLQHPAEPKFWFKHSATRRWDPLGPRSRRKILLPIKTFIIIYDGCEAHQSSRFALYYMQPLNIATQCYIGPNIIVPTQSHASQNVQITTLIIPLVYIGSLCTKKFYQFDFVHTQHIKVQPRHIFKGYLKFDKKISR